MSGLRWGVRVRVSGGGGGRCGGDVVRRPLARRGGEHAIDGVKGHVTLELTLDGLVRFAEKLADLSHSLCLVGRREQ